MNTQQDSINRDFEAKVRRGMFNPIARYITNEMTAEDRFQDALCATWWLYRRKAEEGKLLDDALLVFAARRWATNLDRSFVGTGGRKCLNQDVLDPRAYRDGKVDLVEFNESYLSVGRAEVMCCSPVRKVNSALDLYDWLDGLVEDDQRLMAAKMKGMSTREASSELKKPYARTWRREKELGLQLAHRAGIHINFGRERRGRKRKQATAAG